MICTKEFFGCGQLPEISISVEALAVLAEETVSRGYTVPGVQKKLSMHLSIEDTPRLTLVDYPAGYILKPQTEEYPNLPEFEDMTMDVARCFGIATVPHGLISADGTYAYITKRIDRVQNGKDTGLLAMEDFCQLTGRQTADKYKSSYEKCAGVIRLHSSRRGLDLSEFFLRLVVSFLTGNSDMHLKNFSLIETAPASRSYVLSPAYDLLPVNLILPDDRDETALMLDGKRSNLKRQNFLHLAETCGIGGRAAEKMIAGCLKREPKAEVICRASLLDQRQQDAFIQLMRTRCDRLCD